MGLRGSFISKKMEDQTGILMLVSKLNSLLWASAKR